MPSSTGERNVRASCLRHKMHKDSWLLTVPAIHAPTTTARGPSQHGPGPKPFKVLVLPTARSAYGVFVAPPPPEGAAAPGVLISTLVVLVL
jgi:hypothetical protein